MGEIFGMVSAWKIAILFAFILIGAWRIGVLYGQRRKRRGISLISEKAEDASLALLGLLLAFTFSMALSRHDDRRKMVVDDSNSIGDFYTCASLQKEPVRSKLQNVLRDYARLRLNLALEHVTEVQLDDALHRIQKMQNEMTALVAEAIEQGTPIANPLTNTLNELTSAHAARLAAIRNRLPATIVALLFSAAILSMALVGERHGVTGVRHNGGTLGLILLICLVTYVTLDLNQPDRGVIRVSQEPMERLLAGMR